MDMKRYIFPIIGILAITLLVVFWFYEKKVDQDAATAMPAAERQADCEQFLTVGLFSDNNAEAELMETCLRGEPVLPGEQEEPLSADGELRPAPPVKSPSSGGYTGAGCAVSGCGQQICGAAGEVEDMVTSCEWKEEYACYAASRCEKQANGQCGWTETAELNQCITNAAASQESSVTY
jgi:hypothetical protein